MSSVKNKAKSNLLAAGLFGGSFLLAGLKPPKTNKKERGVGAKNNRNDEDDDKNDDKNYTEDESQSLGFLSGFTEENVGDNAFGFGSPFDTDTVGDDAFGFGGFDSTEIIKNITDEKSESGKKQLLLMLEKEGDRIENQFELNKQLLLEKDVSSITAERNTVEEAINNLKLNKKDNKFGGNDYLQKLIKDKNIKINSNEGITSILNDISKIGDGELFDNIVNPRDKVQSDSSYSSYTTNTVYNQPMNIDGGTTIIEGGTEVVNEPVIGNQRGEVIADSPSLKTANSPVTAIVLSESNSIKNLSIV